MLKNITRYILILIILIIIYIFSLFIVSKIPLKLLKKNIAISTNQMYQKYEHSNLLFRDLFTDAIMFDIIFKIDENKPLESAFKANVRSIKEGIDCFDGYIPIIALRSEFNFIDKKDEQENNLYNYTYSYGRFWHGYLTYLRPMLIFLNYNQITILNEIILSILLTIFEFLVYKKLGLPLSLIMLLALMSINYFEIGLSLSLFPTLVIIMIFSIYILKQNEKIKDFNLVFLINGSLTCFFSWMTFTPLTFGIPILLYYLLNNNNNNNLKDFIFITISYLFGFLVTWALKWILSDIIFGTNIIQNSYKQILLRTSNHGMSINIDVNFFEVLITNIRYRLHFICIYILLYMIYIFICTIFLHKISKFSYIKKTIFENYILIILGMITFFIYLIIPNHSFVHAGSYSNRLLMLPELVFLILLYKCESSS